MVATDNDIFLQAMSHVGQRRRQRIKGYYSCINCNNQFIKSRPTKEATCPICFEQAKLVQTVDEFAVETIKMSSGDMLIEEDDNDEKILSYRFHYFDRPDKKTKSQKIERYISLVKISKGENIEP